MGVEFATVSREQQLERALRDAQHASAVMTKALGDVCSGAVTLAQLKAWWESGENPPKPFGNGGGSR